MFADPDQECAATQVVQAPVQGTPERGVQAIRSLTLRPQLHLPPSCQTVSQCTIDRSVLQLINA